MSRKIDRLQLNKYDIGDLIVICHHERAAFRHQDGDRLSSPACAELFRRAFDGDNDSWSAVIELFGPQMRSWAKIDNIHQYVDTDDIVQDALLQFAKYGPKSITNYEIAPLLAYLRRCVKTSVSMHWRKIKRDVTMIDITTIEIQDEENDLADICDADILLRRAEELLLNQKEMIVFKCYFILDLNPREIMNEHNQNFANMKEIYLTVQRIMRRLRNDVIIKELYNI